VSVALQALTRVEIPIVREDDIVLVRRKARALAQARGFDAFATTAVTTAASEIARNCWCHGKGGVAVLEEVSDGVRVGVRIVVEDQGPGIPDIPRVLAGGFSTGRSLGLGVSGSKRLVDEFDVQSEVGKGTRVWMIKWPRF
jgi:serine/threonine-protein kinase RsbT